MNIQFNNNGNFKPPSVWPVVYPPVYPIPKGHTPAYTIVRRDITPFPIGPPPVTYIPTPHSYPGIYTNLGTYPTLFEAQIAAHNAIVDLGNHYASMGYTGHLSPHIDLDTIATVTYELRDGGELLISEFEIKELRAPVWGHAAFEYHRPGTELDIEQYKSERALFFPPHMGQPSMSFPSLNMPPGPKVVVRLPPKKEDGKRTSVGVEKLERRMRQEKNSCWAATRTPWRTAEEGLFRGARHMPRNAIMQRNMSRRERALAKIVFEQPDELADRG